MPAVDYWPR